MQQLDLIQNGMSIDPSMIDFITPGGSGVLRQHRIDGDIRVTPVEPRLCLNLG